VFLSFGFDGVLQREPRFLIDDTVGSFGTYLFELEAQPGGPCGWPNKKPGSKPKNIFGQPHR
jgi:hypothetical protein